MTRYVLALAFLAAACAPGTTTTQAPPPVPVTPTVPPAVSGAQPVQSATQSAPSRPSAVTTAPKTTAPKSTAPGAPPKTIAKAAVPAPAPHAAPLDLKSLEQRLKQSDAIGVLTKLSLKNQVDDLVGRFKSYHEGHRPPTLTDLRPAFDLLLMKVLSLLQDHDTALASDINASREAIWGVLTDPQRLAQFT